MSPYSLYLVTDDKQTDATFAHVIEQAVKGGVTMVQVREKKNDIRAFLRRAKLAKSVLTGSKVPLIINDRLDVALAIDADGVHLGQSDFPPYQARALIGKDKYLGLTVESMEQLQQAQNLPLDYLGISTVFSTQTKQDTLRVWGIEGLTEAVKTSQIPLVAIGGIGLDNLLSVISTGVNGVALVSLICQAKDPKQMSANCLTQILTTQKHLK
jgi:thiamine-phosphate pyrophosphorylase